MKIIRAFVGFVMISLVVGLGSAFNGKSVPKTSDDLNEKVIETIELSELTDIEEEIKESIEENVVEKEKSNKQKTIENNNSKETTTNSIKTTKTEKKESTTTANSSKSNDNSTSIETPVIENYSQQETTTSQVVEDTASSDAKFNSMYYSITKGNPEYPTLSDCNSVGYKIKNNELDEILNWNENNPDNFKQPIIKAHWCYEVMKDGKIHYYLHLITETGANMDEELKRLYK